MVMDTLYYIHGHDYKLKDVAEYKEKRNRTRPGYWEDRGNLVILGGCDYSHKPELNNTEDALKSFAVMKLERFGFFRSHCIEALDHHKGNVDKAIELLAEKYFPQMKRRVSVSSAHDDKKELEELRVEEKSSMESIYGEIFEEKERDKIWQFKWQLDYLLKYSPAEVKRKAERDKLGKKAQKTVAKAPCPYYLKGNCKFGNRCRYSHMVDTRHLGAVEEVDVKYFFLEIRFQENSQYPYEPPVILLSTSCNDFPAILLLRLTRLIVDEAHNNALDGMSSLYSICELLQNEDTVLEYLDSNIENFLHPQRSLFYTASLNGNADINGLLSKVKLPSHYKKGDTGRDGRVQMSKEMLLKEDLNIMRRFFDKRKTKQYEDMMRNRQSLPAWDKRQEILDLLHSNQVVVISGETGCGKSTQVPQFVLDDWMERLKTNQKSTSHVEIICTQPRRLSAIGVAQRVSDERTDRLGNTVGYQIRLENKISTSTRLTFCTTGILLRRLQSDPSLETVSHVIVDEVHERSEESDFLLLILKELLQQRRDLKVILMSATLNANLFSNYFSKAPVLDIPGRTFPVEQFFLEDILEMSKFILEADSQFCKKLTKKEQEELMKELEFSDVQASGEPPGKSIRDESLKMAQVFNRYKDYSKATCKSLFLLDPLKVNPELIEAVLRYVFESFSNILRFNTKNSPPLGT